MWPNRTPLILGIILYFVGLHMSASGYEALGQRLSDQVQTILDSLQSSSPHKSEVAGASQGELEGGGVLGGAS